MLKTKCVTLSIISVYSEKEIPKALHFLNNAMKQ